MSEDASKCRVTDGEQQSGAYFLVSSEKIKLEPTNGEKKGIALLFVFIMNEQKVKRSSSCDKPVTTTAGPCMQKRKGEDEVLPDSG